MRLNAARFDRHLANLGQRFTYRCSYMCSCINPNSGQATPGCPICAGKGHFWDDAIPAMAASANQKAQMAWASTGLYKDGDIVLTVPQNSPIWDAGQFDRLTMLDGSQRFSQALRRGDPTERLLFTPKAFERVFWISPTTKALVDGGLPVADAKGNLSWTEKAPPPGTTYTLTGTRLQEYFLFQELPRNRNMHSGVRLPKMVVVREMDLFKR